MYVKDNMLYLNNDNCKRIIKNCKACGTYREAFCKEITNKGYASKEFQNIKTVNKRYNYLIQVLSYEMEL